MTFEWVLSANRMPLEVQADAVLRLAAADTQKNKRYIDEVVELNAWKIERKVVEIPELKNCFILHLSALDEQGKIIAVYEEVTCTL